MKAAVLAVTVGSVLALAAARAAGQETPPKPPNPKQFVQAGTNEHPLQPVIRWATQEMPAIEALNDYSATLVKRERVDGKLGGYESMELKIRNKPFSVYLHFLSPAVLREQEVIYIEGQNEGKMWVHRGVLSTLRLTPDGEMAMRGHRYPLTEIGLVNLVHRLVEVAEHDAKFGECEVKYFPGTKLNNRVCTMIQVVHPVSRQTFTYHRARVFVDDQLNLPVRFESYDWPQEPGAQPELLEEYTYIDLKLNNGFADADFSIANPQYRFPPKR
jgi:hypothetical protein